MTGQGEVATCPEGDGLVRVTETYTDLADPGNRFQGLRTYSLICGHALVVEVKWCSTCKRLSVVADFDDEAQGNPEHSGTTRGHNVWYLECGHEIAFANGRDSSVL